MDYYYSKTTKYTYSDAIEKIKLSLKNEGFGVLTEIDIKATLKKKLDVDFKNYCILGACNPPFAYEALKAEDNIGILLPCNVIVQEKENGQVEIAAVNPISAMQAVKNEALQGIATQISTKLQNAVNNA